MRDEGAHWQDRGYIKMKGHIGKITLRRGGEKGMRGHIGSYIKMRGDKMRGHIGKIRGLH